MKTITSVLIFLGTLFVELLLLSRVSAVAAPLTGNDNTWISETSSCPGWGELAEIAPSATVHSYEFGGSNQLIVDQWGWQDNGATADQYTYDFYQFGQTTEPVTGGTDNGIGTGVGVQILGQGVQAFFGGNNWASSTYYVGTAGGNGISTLLIGPGGLAEGAQWQLTNPSGQTVLLTYYDWPQDYNGYSLYNPIQNFQNDFVGLAGTNTLEDFVAGSGQFTYAGGSSFDDNNGCKQIITGENSNMVYTSPSCGSVSCTQSFNAPSGYEGHNTGGPNDFYVQFGNGWGTTTAGVYKGDLLIATEGTYSGAVTFKAPTDSLGNTWTADGGGVYCSTYDCVAIWHAVAKSSGTDTVTFSTTASSGYTYGFLREFVGYGGGVRTSAHNSGTSGTPSVSSFTPSSGDLVIAVAAVTTGGSWQTGQYYYMIGVNTGWFAATEFSAGWTHGATTAPWGGPNGDKWAELAVDYSHP